MLAAGGYPDTVRKGDVIGGLDAAARLPGKVFHAGTKLADGRVITHGGRVLCAVGLGRQRVRRAVAGVRAGRRHSLDRHAMPQGHRLSRNRQGKSAREDRRSEPAYFESVMAMSGGGAKKPSGTRSTVVYDTYSMPITTLPSFESTAECGRTAPSR